MTGYKSPSPNASLNRTFSRRVRKYAPLPFAEAAGRRSLAPSREFMRTVAGLIGAHTGTAYGAPENASISRVQIFRELVESLQELTPLPQISRHAAMYPPRLSEIREDLKPLGLTIQCYEDRVAVAGSKYKQNHSYYRIERIAAEQNQQRSLSVSMDTDEAHDLFDTQSSSSLVDFEMGRRPR